MFHSLFLALLAGLVLHTTAATYTLSREYAGDTFFQGWNFFTGSDPTSGHVSYQTQDQAIHQGLIRTQADTYSTGKQVYIGVDNTNQAPNGRPSVRISTQESFQHGLIIADIAHQPGGVCGVWPAFWMVGSNWPQNGEIDIVEGVSTQATNQMTLHTNTGPVLNQQAGFSGKLVTPNCDVNAPNQSKNAGCGITDDSELTFGSQFNAIGGGIYATEWTSQSIKIWFFPRNQIPADIQAGEPIPSLSWGTPNSVFEGNFDMDDHFRNLNIVLNTDFCGDWAGAVWSDTPECAALAPTCDEYVANNPAAFQQAFWLVNTIQVFQNDNQAISSALPTTLPVSTPVPTSIPSTVVSATPTFPSASISSVTVTHPYASSSLFTMVSVSTPAPTSIPGAATPATPVSASKSTSTLTITQTFTIYPSHTLAPQPLTGLSWPVTQAPLPSQYGTQSMTPPETYGLPDGYSDSRRKRHGGAVLPLILAKDKPLAGSR